MDSPNTGIVDEAQEKLFGESNSSGSKIEIKFVTDPKNGDTKIDISEVRQVFVGMGKEELMQFANNPFWVRMRWFLFVLFWAVWFGMLAGAIAIILLAPKCAAPADKMWYQESPIYHLNLKDFKDSSDDGIGDIAGLTSQLDYFKELGVQSILLDPIMKTDDGSDNIIDFLNINPAYGTMNDLKTLIASAKEKGLHLLMKIVPNFCSDKHEWFNKSIAGEEPFKDYFVWMDPSHEGLTPTPGNNWLSVTGGPAWTYNDQRKQFYLHQFRSNQPDFNFRNDNVVKYFEEVFDFWLRLGFDGLYLDKVEYLVEDKDFKDEALTGSDGKTHDEYDFFAPHAHTTHLQESWKVLTQWSRVFKKNSAIFAVSGVPDLKEADLIWRPLNIQKSIKPADLENKLLKRLNKTSQAWEFSCSDCEEKLRVALEAVLLMLPGAAILPSGLELGLPPSSLIPWNSEPEKHGFTLGKPWKPFAIGTENRTVQSEKSVNGSYFNIFKTIINERRSPSVLEGKTTLTVQNSVILISRNKTASSEFFVILNLDDSNQVINLRPFFGKGIVKSRLITDLNIKGDLTSIKAPSNDNVDLEIPGNRFLIYEVFPKSE